MRVPCLLVEIRRTARPYLDIAQKKPWAGQGWSLAADWAIRQAATQDDTSSSSSSSHGEDQSQIGDRLMFSHHAPLYIIAGLPTDGRASERQLRLTRWHDSVRFDAAAAARASASLLVGHASQPRQTGSVCAPHGDPVRWIGRLCIDAPFNRGQ